MAIRLVPATAELTDRIVRALYRSISRPAKESVSVENRKFSDIYSPNFPMSMPNSSLTGLIEYPGATHNQPDDDEHDQKAT